MAAAVAGFRLRGDEYLGELRHPNGLQHVARVGIAGKRGSNLILPWDPRDLRCSSRHSNKESLRGWDHHPVVVRIEGRELKQVQGRKRWVGCESFRVLQTVSARSGHFVNVDVIFPPSGAQLLRFNILTWPRMSKFLSRIV